MSGDTEQHVLAAARLVSAPAEQAYAAWTDSEQVRRWWGPHGFHCPLATMDVRVGGVSRVTMQAAPEYGRSDDSQLLALHPNGGALPSAVRLALHRPGRHRPHPRAQAGIPGDGVPAVVPHLVTFAAVTDRDTAILVLETGYTTDRARDLSRHGLEQCLDKLSTHLKAAGRGSAAG